MNRRPGAWALLLFFSALLYARLYWGVDLSDESQQVHNAAGPAINSRPFVDEWTFTQTGSLLFTPLAALFVRLSPELDYLVLFFRHIYFLMAVATAVFLYRVWCRYLPPLGAAMVASAPLMMIPLALPNVSYNSLVYFLGLCGVHLLLPRQAGRRAPWPLAGLVHGVAAYAHPSYYLTGPILAAQLWWKRRFETAALYFASAAAVVLALFAVLILLFGWDVVHRSFTYQSTANVLGAWHKLEIIYSEITGFWERPLLALAWALVMLALAWRGLFGWPLALGTLVLSQPLLLAQDFVYSLHLRIVNYAMATVLLVLIDRAGRRDPRHRELLWWVWWPGLLSGLMMAIVSRNAMASASFGLLLCLLYAFYRVLHAPKTEAGWRILARYAVAGLVLAQMAYSTMTLIHRDDPVDQLTERVPAGAFAGLYTSPLRMQLLNSVAADLREFEKKGGRVFFYDLFPAGYLMTAKLRPAGPLTMPMFTDWYPRHRYLMLDYFSDASHLPEFVFEFRLFAPTSRQIVDVNAPDGLNNRPAEDPFKDFFAKSGRYELFHDYKFYRVYIKR